MSEETTHDDADDNENTKRLIAYARDCAHDLRLSHGSTTLSRVVAHDLAATLTTLADIAAAKVAEDEPAKCEGCDAPATRSDCEGVPLCDDCFDGLTDADETDGR